MHRGKVDPGVSELPQSNELSLDHVNRPLISIYVNFLQGSDCSRNQGNQGKVRESEKRLKSQGI